MAVHHPTSYEAHRRKQGMKPRASFELAAGINSFLDAALEGPKPQQPFYEWALQLPEPKSGTLDFDRFPFQKELYAEGESDREVVVKKSTQVGVSAWLLRWMLYWADLQGRTGLYLFPKQAQVYDFSDARVKTVIAASPYLQSRLKAGSVMNKGLKEVGPKGQVYFRGTESKTGLDSVDADVLALDEYDTLTAENIPDVERRIGASATGMIRRVGVPSIPDFGISALYSATDKREWYVKCQACTEWQPINFGDNVDQQKAIIICRKCTKPLDVGGGEWVAEYPDRGIRGYHVSRLIAPHANLQEIIDASRKRAPYQQQVHHNKDLGEEWAAEEGRLSDEALAAAQDQGGGYVMQPGYVGSDLVTMGVDVASTRALNVRISRHLDDGRKQALLIAEVSDFNELDLLMDRYSVRMCAIDHLPEGRLARAFAERHAGRVYLVAYESSGKVPSGGDIIRIDDEARFATIRRVEIIDATFTMIRQQRNLLPLNWPDDYPKQMKSLIRTVETDDVGRRYALYRKTGADDDYAQAEIYDLAATILYDYRQGVDLHNRQELRPLDEQLEWERSDLAATSADPDADPDIYLGGSSDYDGWE